ncbi:hypothetical protein PybrP1_006729 [[Pythium] brassicae (nom. inval.)]|nr:hypothetical protein PybrP1_006729 [[Pythium] brassicae (nom. inval.)]
MDDIKSNVEAVPSAQRTTVRSTAARFIGKGLPLRRATAGMKPMLSAELLLERLRFALAFVRLRDGTFILTAELSRGSANRRSADIPGLCSTTMHDVVHVDEKGFFVHRASSCYVLTESQ